MSKNARETRDLIDKAAELCKKAKELLMEDECDITVINPAKFETYERIIEAVTHYVNRMPIRNALNPIQIVICDSAIYYANKDCVSVSFLIKGPTGRVPVAKGAIPGTSNMSYTFGWTRTMLTDEVKCSCESMSYYDLLDADTFVLRIQRALYAAKGYVDPWFQRIMNDIIDLKNITTNGIYSYLDDKLARLDSDTMRPIELVDNAVDVDDHYLIYKYTMTMPNSPLVKVELD